MKELLEFEYWVSSKNIKKDNDFDYKVNYYYSFILENEDILEKMYNSILNINSLKLNKQKEFVKTFQFESKYDITLLVYTVSILKCFEDDAFPQKNDTTDDINYDFIDSDRIINLTLIYINNYFI